MQIILLCNVIWIVPTYKWNMMFRKKQEIACYTSHIPSAVKRSAHNVHLFIFVLTHTTYPVVICCIRVFITGYHFWGHPASNSQFVIVIKNSKSRNILIINVLIVLKSKIKMNQPVKIYLGSTDLYSRKGSCLNAHADWSLTQGIMRQATCRWGSWSLMTTYRSMKPTLNLTVKFILILVFLPHHVEMDLID